MLLALNNILPMGWCTAKYLSREIATVINIDPLMATDWTGYKKYGNMMVWIWDPRPKFRRKFSNMDPKRYQLSKAIMEINSKLNVFRISSLKRKTKHWYRVTRYLKKFLFQFCKFVYVFQLFVYNSPKNLLPLEHVQHVVRNA